MIRDDASFFVEVEFGRLGRCRKIIDYVSLAIWRKDGVLDYALPTHNIIGVYKRYEELIN